MAGDKAKAVALVGNLNKLIADLEDRFGSDGLAIRDRARTAADGESVGNYAIRDLRSLYAKLTTRVNAMQDSA